MKPSLTSCIAALLSAVMVSTVVADSAAKKPTPKAALVNFEDVPLQGPSRSVSGPGFAASDVSGQLSLSVVRPAPGELMVQRHLLVTSTKNAPAYPTIGLTTRSPKVSFDFHIDEDPTAFGVRCLLENGRYIGFSEIAAEGNIVCLAPPDTRITGLFFEFVPSDRPTSLSIDNIRSVQ